MNPLRALTRPVRHITEAFVMPLRALFVVGLCGFINWMTFSGTWWVKWVALGMGIAVVLALARGAKALLLLALVAFVGWKVYQRWGAAARSRFDDWVARTQPQTAQVLALLLSPAKRAEASEAQAG